MAFAPSTTAPANTAGSSIFGGGATQPGQTQTNSLFGQPTTSLFGGQQGQQQAQQPAKPNIFGQPSVFGQSTQTQAQQPSTSLFGATTTAQPAATPFGAPAQQQQPAATTNIFGQPQTQQAATATPAAPSLFGQPTQPAAPSLFGQPLGQQQPQQQQQQGGSLFGGGTSFFGGGQQNQQQQQQSTLQPSLFGGNAASTQPQSSGFGGSTTNPLGAQPTLQANTFNNPFGGGNSFLGKPQQPQQSLGFSAPQQPTAAPPFTKATKFNDLPDEIKRTFDQIEAHIQGRVQIGKDLQKRKLGQEATKGQELVRVVHKDLVNTAATLRSDLNFTQDLKLKVDQAVEDTIISTRIVDGFRNSQTYGSFLKDHASFPLEFFIRVTEQMSQKLAWYKATSEQIERKLASLANQTQYSPQGIAATLQAQHATFLTLAAKTAALDAELQKIKAVYTQLWRQRTGSVRDPFNELDMDKSESELGLMGMSIR